MISLVARELLSSHLFIALFADGSSPLELSVRGFQSLLLIAFTRLSYLGNSSDFLQGGFRVHQGGLGVRRCFFNFIKKQLVSVFTIRKSWTIDQCELNLIVAIIPVKTSFDFKLILYFNTLIF